MTGVRERGLPDPGCSAVPRRSGLNLTSWSGYREFTDRSPCQADLATTSTSAAGQEDGRWAGIPALPLRTRTERQSLARVREPGWRTRELQKCKERMNHGANIAVIKNFVFPIFSSSS